MRGRLPGLECAQVRALSGKPLVDGGNWDAGINRFALIAELEVQVHRVVNRVPLGRIWRRQFFEDIKIDLDPVFFLAGCRAELGETLKGFPIFGLRFVMTLA